MTPAPWSAFLLLLMTAATGNAATNNTAPGNVAATPPQTLTLEQAQALLFARGPDLRLERLETEKARAELQEARAAYWPSLDATASYQAFTDPNHIHFQLPPPSNTVIDRDLGDRTREEYAIDLSYPLIGGGARRQQELWRKAALRSTESRAEARANGLSLQLAAIYCAWHAAAAAARAQDTLARLQGDQAAHIREMVRQGAALASQEAGARARWLQARAEALSAKDTRDSLSRAAALLLGLSPEALAGFAESPAPTDAAKAGGMEAGQQGRGAEADRDPAPSPSFPPSSPSASSPASPSSHPRVQTGVRADLAALDQTAEGLDYKRTALFRQRFPSLYAQAGYRLANPGLNLGSEEYMDYGVVGLQVKWNLFDGFKSRAQRAALQAQIRMVETERARLEAFWNESVLSALSRRESLALRTEAAQAALEAAQENRRETGARVRGGTAPDAESLEARAQEVKALLQLRQAELQQQFAEWQLRFARGETLVFSQGE